MSIQPDLVELELKATVAERDRAQKDCERLAFIAKTLKEERQEAREILAGPAIGSLPNDYPLNQLALETWNTLQERTTEGLALVGKVETLEQENKRLQTQVGRLMTAIGWLIPPFVDENTSKEELLQRIKFCVADADRAVLKEGKG